ncbi:MAG: hypothetical protein ABJB66_19955 [Gemmatimonadaceae bacterium]
MLTSDSTTSTISEHLDFKDFPNARNGLVRYYAKAWKDRVSEGVSAKSRIVDQK